MTLLLPASFRIFQDAGISGTQVEGLGRPEEGSKNKGSGEAVHDGWLLLVELSGGRGRGEWVGVGHEVRGVREGKGGREGEAVCER